jgi:hypothetical protein
VVAVQAGDAATGRAADENEMDAISFSGQALAGQVLLKARAHDGPVTGKYRVNYWVG